jgi:hypothetical protein
MAWARGVSNGKLLSNNRSNKPGTGKKRTTLVKPPLNSIRIYKSFIILKERIAIISIVI